MVALGMALAWRLGVLEKVGAPRDLAYVIFTSDNGGEEDPVNSGAWNGPLREDKGQMYEGGIRVPWIVWSQNPDLVRGGGRANETIINSTDLYTTFASYAQAALPAGVCPCGEGGEFHTFVWDGPGFVAPVALKPAEVRAQASRPPLAPTTLWLATPEFA